MRPEADVREVFRLAVTGHTTSEIARRVGIARATVRAWVVAGQLRVLARPGRWRIAECAPCGYASNVDEPAFAYLLGQYLGDGCISPMRSSFRLRITFSGAYPKIIDECAAAIRRVRPDGRVGYVSCPGCTEVSNYWRHWPCLLPHGDGGVKHLRQIED